MDRDDLDELSRCERRALLVWRLCEGVHISTAEAARLLDVTRLSARRFLNAIGRVVPIYLDDSTNPPRWRRVRE